MGTSALQASDGGRLGRENQINSVKPNASTKSKRTSRRGGLKSVGIERRTGAKRRRSRGQRIPSNASSRSAIRTIVVPVDLTEPAYRAVDYAVLLAKRFDASIALLHVVHRIYAEGFVDRGRSAIRIEARENARRRLNALAKSKLSEGVPIECIVRDGAPKYEIIRFAANRSVDLIVIGRKMRKSLTRFIFGSVTRGVIDTSQCPVVVVPERYRTRLVSK